MTRKKHHFLAWTIWFLSSLFMFYKYAIEVSPSVMTTHLMSEFHIDGAQLGNLAACYFYAYLLIQIPAGLLVDRFGPRRVTTIAIAICAFGTIVFANSSILFLAQLGRFLSGFGAAFAALNCLKLTANWFPSNRFALMAGLMMTLGMLGAVAGQAPLSAFINSMSWRQALFIIGVAGLVLAAIFWLVVRDQSKYHLAPINLMPKNSNLWESVRSVFKNKQSWLLSIYSGFAFAPLTVFGGLWGVPYIAETFQVDKTHAAQVVSLIFIGFAVGAPLWGWFSDFIGNRKKVMYVGTSISTIAFCFILYAPLSLWSLNILMFLFGFFASTFLICFSMIRETNAPAVAATAIGFMNAFDALLAAFSDPLTGKFLDLAWDGKTVEGARIFSVVAYKWTLTTVPIYLIAAVVLLFFIKETHCKHIYPSTMP
ncbi:MAG: putative sulfoacetate transporter SauU [Chlamydiae bacterium]|nr:putative sulfoacetate transporter SauU [Chlamydiota bacterium]